MEDDRGTCLAYKAVSRDVTVRGTAGCVQWTAHVSGKGGRVNMGGVSFYGRHNWAIVGGGLDSHDGEYLTVTVTGTGRHEALDLADALAAAAAALRQEVAS